MIEKFDLIERNEKRKTKEKKRKKEKERKKEKKEIYMEGKRMSYVRVVHALKINLNSNLNPKLKTKHLYNHKM